LLSSWTVVVALGLLVPPATEPALVVVVGWLAVAGVVGALRLRVSATAAGAPVDEEEDVPVGLATPPWCEQAPCPPFDVEPSLQVTVALAPAAGWPAAPPPVFAEPDAPPAGVLAEAPACPLATPP
jgi:hypothetical protein